MKINSIFLHLSD